LRAFWATYRTTPYRYLHALRLDEARRMLSSGTTNLDTVTQVAMRFGFRELGRFAADYRAAFGESPSHTLRSASAMAPEGNSKRADADVTGNGFES
jgi:transcriptional regulator GlxA family with amidase domain